MKPSILTLSLTLGALLVCTAHAQERTAGGTVETQMTWTALSSAVNGVNGRVDTVVIRVDQSEKCGRKGMVYAPGMAGRDADGCIYAGLNPATQNTINNMNTTVNGVNSCGASGHIYNSATRSCVQAQVPQTSANCRISGREGRRGCNSNEILVDQYYHTPDFGYVVGGTCISVVCN